MVLLLLLHCNKRNRIGGRERREREESVKHKWRIVVFDEYDYHCGSPVKWKVTNRINSEEMLEKAVYILPNLPC